MALTWSSEADEMQDDRRSWVLFALVLCDCCWMAL